MAVNFTAGAVPTVTRAVRENPYTGLVKALAANREQSQIATVAYKSDDDKKAVDEIIRLAQSAGRDEKVTIRKTLVVDEKAGKAVLTLWATDAITRTRTVEAPAAE